jgi:hypothetical protein
VLRFRLWLATALALGAIVGSLLHAQVSDEEKRKRQETDAVSSPTPEESPSPIAKAKAVKQKSKNRAAASATPEESPKPSPKRNLGRKIQRRRSNAKPKPAKREPNLSSQDQRNHLAQRQRTKAAKKISGKQGVAEANQNRKGKENKQ